MRVLLISTYELGHQPLHVASPAAALRGAGLSAAGELGDYRPLRALDAAVRRFQPDQLVIAEARSAWLRLGMVDKVRAAYPIPLTHVVPGANTAAAPARAT